MQPFVVYTTKGCIHVRHHWHAAVDKQTDLCRLFLSYHLILLVAHPRQHCLMLTTFCRIYDKRLHEISQGVTRVGSTGSGPLTLRNRWGFGVSGFSGACRIAAAPTQDNEGAQMMPPSPHGLPARRNQRLTESRPSSARQGCSTSSPASPISAARCAPSPC